jgi:hypothetical protein
MAWRGWVIPYTTKRQKNFILKLLKKHNELLPFELFFIKDFELSESATNEHSKVISFLQEGWQDETISFLEKELITKGLGLFVDEC